MAAAITEGGTTMAKTTDGKIVPAKLPVPPRRALGIPDFLKRDKNPLPAAPSQANARSADPPQAAPPQTTPRADKAKRAAKAPVTANPARAKAAAPAKKRASEAPMKTAAVSGDKPASKASLIKAAISAGKDDETIVQEVRSAFPGCEYKASDVKWYRRKLVKTDG
jgi:hypothetical protein